MGVVGAAIKGFGKALMKGKKGTGTVKVKPAIDIKTASRAEIEASRQRGHVKVWSQRQKIARDLNKKVEEGKKAVRKRSGLVQTKVLEKKPWGTFQADPSTGAKGTAPWSAPVKRSRKTKKPTKTSTKTKHYYPPKDF